MCPTRRAPSSQAMPAGDADRVEVETRADCPFTLGRASMWQRWESLTFLHWRYPSDVVQRLLPRDLTVEEHGSAAWVGLVPFTMTVSLPHVAAPPWLGRFEETNVRTYVRDSAGRSGVWFFSLDAARLAAVVVARTAYRLPYFWSSMSVRRDADIVEYAMRRRSSGSRAESKVVLRTGREYASHELGALDHFLTARYRVFSKGRTKLRYVEAEHDPWPLRHGEVIALQDTLVTAAGLPEPIGDPVVHYSDGVKVRLGLPQTVSR